MVLDFSVPPIITELEAIIKTAADLAHQSEDNVILLVYPTSYPGVNVAHVLNMQRKIEDRLMSHKLTLQADATCVQNYAYVLI